MHVQTGSEDPHRRERARSSLGASGILFMAADAAADIYIWKLERNAFKSNTHFYKFGKLIRIIANTLQTLLNLFTRIGKICLSLGCICALEFLLIHFLSLQFNAKLKSLNLLL